MSEEKTQIFRGDEPPEMAIAETSEIERRKPLDAPVDQRGMHDQKDGASFDRSMHDATGGPAEQRRMEDADGLSDLRQLHGKSGGEGAGPLSDADGPADPRHLHDASLGIDGATMRDGEGPSDARRMNDAEGLSDQRQMNDADGLSDRREMRDHHALIPGAAEGEAELQADEEAQASVGGNSGTDAQEAAAEEVMSDPDLTFKVEDDATPWALSIHLEERIASLGLSTTKVNHQLDVLEDSIQRLAKRIAK